MTQTLNRPTEQLSQRAYIEALIAGQVPDTAQRPQFEPEIDGLVEKGIDLINKGRTSAARRHFDQCKNIPAFAAIFNEPQQNTAPIIEDIHDNATIVPPLTWGLLPKELGQGVSPWFDDYVAFSKKWSGRACDIQHKGAALWLLSTIAARRIAASYGGLQFTPLYIALVAPSTVYAKTTTAKIATDVLSRTGLHWLLGSNSPTPEKLLSNMAGKFIPSNWDSLTPEQQEFEEKRLAYSGQLGWYYSEFGNLIKEMSNDKGRNTAFKAILQRMDDGEEYFETDTVKRGKERIERPYLALLGTMTPDCMKPYSGSDASSWGDGTYARFAFCCPPADKKKTREMLRAERFPDEEKIYPSSLITPLRNWHNRLGEHICKVIPSDQGKEISYAIQHSETYPLTVYRLGTGVKNALDDYGDALDILAQETHLKQFRSNYGRLRDKTLRIATLMASLENSNTIELRHLAFAQSFSEELRESLHHLDMFLHENNFASERNRMEDEIIQYVAKADTHLTSRIMRKNKFKNQAAETFDPLLDSLEKSGDLVSKRVGRTKFYTVPGKEDRPMPVNQAREEVTA
jgi:hypothetical protein